MPLATVCHSCNSGEFEKDHQTGEVVCNNCGSVLEESRIVSEVSFGETSAGKAIVTGQYVSHDQSGVIGNSLYGMQSGESRHQTIEKAKHRMERIGHRLAIPDHVIEGGLRFFRSALANNFVKGRKSQHVLSACLYLSCRIGRTDHMLMDFAELIHVNVFHIGATYLQLVRNQAITNLPIVDPTVYIQRFTAKLQFGADGGKRVVNDAKLLVHRMGKDWLQQGRRPAGVAAACILLAARMNNYRRSKAEIVLVAKIAEETLQRRLDEFKTTAAGTLTVQDFRGTNVESAADPPSFTRHRELERKMSEKLAKDEELRAQGIEPGDAYLDAEIVAIAKELDKDDGKTIELANDVNLVLDLPELKDAAAHLAKQPRRKKVKEESSPELQLEEESGDEFLDGDDDDEEQLDDDEDEDEEEEEEEEEEDDEDDEDEEEEAEADDKQNNKAEPETAENSRKRKVKEESVEPEIEAEAEPDSEPDSAPAHEDENAALLALAENDGQESGIESLSESEEELVAGELALEERAEENAVENALEETSTTDSPLGRAERYLLEFRKRRALKLEVERENHFKRPQPPSDTVQDDPESLSDVDDDEIESVLLTEEEIDLKSKVWMSLNREYLLDQERKRLRQEADAASGITKPARKKRKARSKPEPGQASTAEANAASMMKEKAPSRKINYSVVKQLFSKK